MRLIPAPNGSETDQVGKTGPKRIRLARPTMSGMVRASASLLLLGVVSVLLLVPTVFYVVPIPPEADAATLCLPGVGPLLRFRDGLGEDQEERAYIHEDAHADQCRQFGATWYAQLAASPEGRLVLESQALCAEVAVLTRRGADPERLVDWTVETLATEYFEDGSVSRHEIAAAVDGACGQATGD